MTDADIDGSHISMHATDLFLWTDNCQLVVSGRVYVAQPPLARIV